jgi:8-oxo-dGTP pyrophosphatase MutT (NUDIX family)
VTSKKVIKVLAYLTRNRKGTEELLVFEHVGMPEAGVQVPAGTVEAGEDRALAVLREIREECGLEIESDGSFIGTFDWFRADRNETHVRNIFHFKLMNEKRDSWDHTVSGEGEDKNLIFRVFWIPVKDAPKTLAVDQGIYIDKI